MKITKRNKDLFISIQILSILFILYNGHDSIFIPKKVYLNILETMNLHFQSVVSHEAVLVCSSRRWFNAANMFMSAQFEYGPWLWKQLSFGTE